MQEYLLHRTSNDPSAEYDEIWILIVPANGEPFIEHDQSGRGSRLAKGKSYYPVNEFLEIGDVVVKTRLKEVLQSIGVDA